MECHAFSQFSDSFCILCVEMSSQVSVISLDLLNLLPFILDQMIAFIISTQLIIRKQKAGQKQDELTWWYL
jgi:hypothetical protein